MINLNKNLCDELNISYYQLRSKSQPPIKVHANVLTINPQDRLLLSNILKAIKIELNDEMIETMEHDVVKVKLNGIVLIFNDVNLIDSATEINLAKLTDMHDNKTLKKATWLKLKNLS